MSKVEPMDFLVRARENEKNYDWIFAASFHEKSLGHSLQQGDLFRAGEFADRIGFCFQRAAMQAKDRSEFEEKIKLARAAMSTWAAKFYGTPTVRLITPLAYFEPTDDREDGEFWCS